MIVNKERIIQRIEKISEYNNNSGKGISRFSYSKEDAAVRKWLIQTCEDLQLNITTDPVGNIRARYEGTDPSLKPILIGSHIDSVRNGGKYDGIVGVVGALEVLSVMKEENYQPKRSVELIVFAEEEGSNFGTTMVGSKALIGKLSVQDMEELKTDTGKPCLDVMREFNLEPEKIANHILKPGDIAAMIELHIEQGIVLEREQKQLGVVRAIAGMSTIEVTVLGEANHAGATPMYMRCDPMSAAALLISQIEDIAAHQILKSTVATIGCISCKPNMPNVIPGEVSFTIDIRDIDEEAILTTIKKIKESAQNISKERGVIFKFNTIGDSKPIILSPRVIDVVRESVKTCTDFWMEMNSGAVHDAAMMAEITDVAMIFVPSVAGKSHNEDEYTSPEDIALGGQALLLSVIELSKK